MTTNALFANIKRDRAQRPIARPPRGEGLARAEDVVERQTRIERPAHLRCAAAAKAVVTW